MVLSQSSNTARFRLAVNEMVSSALRLFFECLPSSDSTKSTLHVCIDDLQAVNVRCIDPTEADSTMLAVGREMSVKELTLPSQRP